MWDICTINEFLGTDNVTVPTPPIAPYGLALVDKDETPQALIYRCKIDPQKRAAVETFLTSINALSDYRVMYQCKSMRAAGRENGRIIVSRNGADVGAIAKTVERI